MAKHKLFIGGEGVDPASGNYFTKINPANTTEILGEFADGSAEDVAKAVQAAEAAFSGWNELPIASREAVLFKAADIIAQKQELLAVLISRESGKTITEARGEVARASVILRFYAGEIRRAVGETYISDNPRTFLYTLREPVGIVGLITPWNFPLVIPLWKLSPAIAFGNTVVMRVSQDSPGVGLAIGEILAQAGLPAGVVNILTGVHRPVSLAIVNHPKISAISFTGSTQVGEELYKAGAALGKKVQLEMGGSNPVIVMEDADLDQAVNICLSGAFWFAGQKCTATSRVLVHQQAAEPFTEALLGALKTWKIGDPLDPATLTGPLVNDRQLAKYLEAVSVGRAEGAELLCGGKRLSGGDYGRGYFVEPTIFTQVKPQMRIAQEEIFAPFVMMMTFRDLDEALEIANGTRYGLSASIVTRDIGYAQKFIRGIKAGIVHVNSQTAGAEAHVPFGGWKQSGLGPKEQGRAAMEFYTQSKTVYFDLPE